MNRKVTRVIAGQAIALAAGKQYLAARPMATRGASRFTVSIYEHKAFHSHATPPTIMSLPPMPYDKANEFLAAFNHGKTSFDGRLWT